MRPKNLKTKIFLDSGNPSETKEIIAQLGFLDGQTTNPTLISKNPKVREHLNCGGHFSEEEMYIFYQQVVKEISALIPQGSISIETYADCTTKAQELFTQGKEMFSWIHNAHIKYPITREGLEAASQSVTDGMRVNMTLCFQQEQAAAVYAATKGATKGQVFVSPFIGRLDDQGNSGMDLINNILKMYRSKNTHVEVLAASLRNIDHLLYALKLGVDIVTAPFEVLKEWVYQGFPIPHDTYHYNYGNLEKIPYRHINLDKNWEEYNITHELTTKGIQRFSNDWNELLTRDNKI
jgi:transaldolase